MSSKAETEKKNDDKSEETSNASNESNATKKPSYGDVMRDNLARREKMERRKK